MGASLGHKFFRYSSFYTNKNTHKWNEFMGASLGVKNKKKEHTWKDDMVLLLKKGKIFVSPIKSTRDQQ